MTQKTTVASKAVIKQKGETILSEGGLLMAWVAWISQVTVSR